MKSIENKINELLNSPIANLGYRLVRVKELTGSKGSKIFQLMIENNDYNNLITHDDCAKVTHYAMELLEVNDVIKGHYNLEVSSTGVERPLTSIEDFHSSRFIDKIITIKLYSAISDEIKLKKFKAILKGAKDNNIAVEIVDNNINKLVEINFDNIISANLYFDFKSLTN